MNAPHFLLFSTTLSILFVLVAGYSILNDLFLRERTKVNQRIDEEFRRKLRDRARKSPLFKNIEQLASESSVGVERPTIWQRLDAMIVQAGMDLQVPKFLGILVATAAIAACLTLAFNPNPVLGGLAGLVGGITPLMVVRFRRDRRIEKLRGQLPDAFDLMARVIRAGQTMPQSMLAVADEFPAPIAAEFSYCYEQQNLGLPPEMTLRDLARRNGLLELRIFVVAVIIQQQTGGNLAELFENLAVVVRERFRMRGAIQALTAEGRMQGLVLLILPLAMFLVMLFINPDYARELFDYPTLYIGTFVFEGLGALWIRKIVNFDF